MSSEKIHVVDPPISFLYKLWLLGLLGFVFPSAMLYIWPDFSWAGKAERSLKQSLARQEWQEPWVAIDQKTFSSGWIRCGSLEDAIRLDRLVDDGHPHTGKLILSEGGVAWRGP